MQVLLVFLSVTFALSLGAKLPLGGTQNIDIQHRIQKGKYAYTGQFPYIVSLLILKGKKGFGCGGSIIDHNWILTAAHCTHNSKWVKIFYGSTENWKSEISHVVRPDNIIEHELYNDFTLLNDIALIRTPRVEYSELVNKVSLPDRDNDYEGAWAVVSGWGENEYDRKQQNLQFVGFQIDSKKFWLDMAGRPSYTIICGGILTGKPTGRGDSGGPLVIGNDPKLIGVSSFGTKGISSCFTRVSDYLDWIRGRTGLK